MRPEDGASRMPRSGARPGEALTTVELKGFAERYDTELSMY
jgi:hypothetical protein